MYYLLWILGIGLIIALTATLVMGLEKKGHFDE